MAKKKVSKKAKTVAKKAVKKAVVKKKVAKAKPAPKKAAKKAVAKKAAKKVTKAVIKKGAAKKNVVVKAGKKTAAKKVSPKKVTKKPVIKVAAKKSTAKPISPPKKSLLKKLAKQVVETVTGAPVKEAKAKVVAKSKSVEAKKKVPAKKKAAKKAPKSAEMVVKDVLKEAMGRLADPKEVSSEKVVLTDAEGRQYCCVSDCDQLSNVEAYCRYHYLLYWKKIQNRKKILSGGKLECYIEELTAKFPDKFVEQLKKDLRSEKEFGALVNELELGDESSTSGGEALKESSETQTYIDEIRGVSSDSRGVPEDDY